MIKKRNSLQDNNISVGNYAIFARCKILSNGHRIRFRYPSGATYEVAVCDILSWFDRPHYIRTASGIKDWPDGREYRMPPGLRAQALRRVLHGHALRIYTTDDTAYDVAWDTVLMACEPRYEWFGGLPVGGRLRLPEAKKG